MNRIEMKKWLCIVFALILVPCLSGCSDDDSGTATTTTKTYGTAIDGLLSGSTVHFDTDNDGEQDSGETVTTTNNVGTFEIADSSSSIIVSGGTDLATNKEFTGTLSAPASSGSADIVVTPITTIVKALVDSGSSVSDAQTTIKQNFGIDSSVDLTTFNPVKAITDSDSDTTDIKEATKLNAIGAQIVNTINAITTAVGASTGSTTALTNTIKGKVIRSIAKTIASSSISDLKDTTKLTTVVDNAVTQIQTDVSDIQIDTTKIDAVKTSTVSLVKTLNEKLDTVVQEADALTDDTVSSFSATDKLTTVSQILVVVADNEDTIETAVTTGVTTDLDTATSTVDTKIQEATVGDVTGANTTPTEVPTVTASAGGSED